MKSPMGGRESGSPAKTGRKGRDRGRTIVQDAVVYGIVLLFLAFGWATTGLTEAALIQSNVDSYQKTELEIVRGVTRSIEVFVSGRLSNGEQKSIGRIEQELFRLFVAPVQLLQSGDAWIYAPDHVVFDQSGDFPKEYRGLSMAAIFEIQERKGASHFRAMTDDVMAARAGVGWYVWLPDKGREIAAWTPVQVGPYVWTVGLSTPLAEIMESTGAGLHLRSTRLLMAVASCLSLAFLGVWAWAERRRKRSEELLSAQMELALALGGLPTLDECLRLCAEAAVRLSRADTAGIYLPDPAGGVMGLRCTVRSPGSADSLAPRLDGPEAPDSAARRHGLAPVTVPLSQGGRTVGFLAADYRPGARIPPSAPRALEAVAAVLGGAVARRHMEESLREEEERFRSVVDTAPDAIVTVDPAGKIAFWNNGARRTFQREERDAVGRRLEEFLAPAAGGAPEEGEAVSVRREGIRGDGTRFPADVSSARWSSRAGTYATHVIRDMSRHERAERENWDLEQKLQRAQRMESLGILAGGVAHDLNNMLAPIVSYAELILEDAPADGPLRASLLEMRGVAVKAGAVVQDLLTLGRRGSYQMKSLDLNALTAEFLSSSVFADARQRNHAAVVEQRLQPGLPPILASAPHLTKVIQNLALNALEAMPQGGRLTVSTEGRVLDAPLSGYERIEAGSYAVLSVADTGTGIETRDLERIFEPFYTKKTMGRSGSGLGLAVVYGVVHDHKGRIDIRTAPGQGSRFSLWFPVSRDAPAEREKDPGDLRGAETVLLVEDQPEQRTVTASLLSRHGYRVATAENGRAAVEYVHVHPVDILVLDMVMDEDFDGLDCWREIVRMRPEQKGIIVSGYAETSRVKEAQDLGMGAFLRKPYTLGALTQAIRNELSRKKAGP